MFITSVDFTQWVYFDRVVLASHLANTLVNVHASNYNSSPHQLRWFNRGGDNLPDPWISTKDHSDNGNVNMVYGEGGNNGYNPQKGSLVFVRLKPIPFSGGSNLG